MITRVAYVVHTNAIGGAENNLLRLLQVMKTGDITPAVVLLPKDGPLAEAVREIQVPTAFVAYHAFNWHNPFRYMKTLGSMCKHTRGARADIIHLNHQGLVEFAVQAGRLTRRPIVCHIRNLLGVDELVPLLPWLLKVDAIVGVSRAVLAPLLAAGLPESRAHLIHNGIDITRLQTINCPRVLHKELKLSDTVRLIGVLGRVVPEKGIEEFIAAAEIVSRQRQDLHFVIVGEDDAQGNYIKRLQRHLQQHGMSNSITFTGFRSDIPDILDDLEVVVLPSRSDMPEGLPNTVLEGLAAGKLVVATRNSGVPEVIQDGVNGLLVDCDDIPGVASAITKALDMPKDAREAMKTAARQSVQDRTVENQVKQLGELYRELLDKRRRKGR